LQMFQLKLLPFFKSSRKIIFHQLQSYLNLFIFTRKNYVNMIFQTFAQIYIEKILLFVNSHNQNKL